MVRYHLVIEAKNKVEEHPTAQPNRDAKSRKFTESILFLCEKGILVFSP